MFGIGKRKKSKARKSSRKRSLSPRGSLESSGSYDLLPDLSDVSTEPSENSSGEEFGLNSSDEAREAEMEAEDEKETAPRGRSARRKFWPAGFIDTKERSTRRSLMKRQKFKKTGDGKATFIGGITGAPVKLRRHTPKSQKKKQKTEPVYVEDRSFDGEPHQPDIDHVTDALAMEMAYDSDEIFSDEASDAEKDTLKMMAYNHEANLRVVSKTGHKKMKKTYRRETIPKKTVEEGREIWRDVRDEQKALSPGSHPAKYRVKRRAFLKKKKPKSTKKGSPK